MIPLDSIAMFFPPELRGTQFARHRLKEYVERLALDWISGTSWMKRLVFIGGTNLRLVAGIDRFSEDIDFDCKDFSPNDFIAMTDGLVAHFRRNGIPAEAKEREGERVAAFRRSISVPGFLHSLGLSGHREEKFLLEIECQDQGIPYERRTASVSGCGFFFPVAVPPESVLCAMKAAALLSRGTGRDYYDFMFLAQRTRPDFPFLEKRVGVPDADHPLDLRLTFMAVQDQIPLRRHPVLYLLAEHQASAGERLPHARSPRQGQCVALSERDEPRHHAGRDGDHQSPDQTFPPH